MAMKFISLTRSALGIGLAAAMLVGCGSHSQGTGTSGMMPQSAAPAGHAAHGKSWMLPEAKSEDLLYASDVTSNVYVYSYPALELVGTLSLPYDSFGLCSDKRGNVFVTMDGPISKSVSNVYEYAHGGTSPIQSLTDPGFGNGCALDPTTGNLAVTNWFGNRGSYDHGNVVVFQHATGSGSLYYDPDIYWYWWCTYDDQGNLYVDGYNEGGEYPFGKLPAGNSTFKRITFNTPFSAYSLQWVDSNLIVSTSTVMKSPEEIYSIQLSGKKGTVVGATALYSRRNRNASNGQYLIAGTRIIGPAYPTNILGFWNYPSGGHPVKRIRTPNNEGQWWGVAISRAKK